MTRRCSWAAVFLAACASQSSAPSPTIAGRYEITSRTASVCPLSPLDLELTLGGGLIDYNAMPQTLVSDGSGAYSASSCQAVECQSMDGGILIFSSARIARTSATTIHGTQAGTSLRTQCTEGVCPAGFGSDAPSCDFDATLSEPAPVITSVMPSTTSSTSCSKPLAIHGGFFQPGATVAYFSAAPSCPTPIRARGGDQTCPLVVDHVTSTEITAHFASCPAQDEAVNSMLTLAIVNPASGSDSAGNLLPGLESLAALQLDP